MQTSKPSSRKSPKVQTQKKPQAKSMASRPMHRPNSKPDQQPSLTRKIVLASLFTATTIILARFLSIRTPVISIGFSTVAIMLSGGERQRLAIALALVRDPACLIYDEATSMLDTDARGRIYQILQDLKAAHKTQLWITHNLDELLVVDNVLVLANQEIKQYTRAEILHQPEILVQAGLKPTLALELVYQLQKHGHEVENLADLQREIRTL